MLVEMSKARIVGVKSDFLPTLDALYNYGKMQFNDLTPEIEAGGLAMQSMHLPDDQEAQVAEMTALQERLTAVSKALYNDENCHLPEGAKNPEAARETPDLISHAQEFLDDVEPRLGEVQTWYGMLDDQNAELNEHTPYLASVAPIVKKLAAKDMSGLDAVTLPLRESGDTSSEELESALQAISSSKTSVQDGEHGDGVAPVVITFEKKYAQQVEDYLQAEYVSRGKLPAEAEVVPLDDVLKEMHETDADLPRMINEHAKTVEDLKTVSYDEIVGMKDAIQNRLAWSGEFHKFGETAHTFAIEGFVPKTDLPSLKEVVESVGEGVVLEEIPIEHKDYPTVPVKMVQKKGTLLESFKNSLSLWGTPMYGSADPSAIIMFSFPFIWGMIVGDAGYGLLLVILCLIGRKKAPDSIAIQNITGVLLPAGFMSILFGIFYYEFFGDMLEKWIIGEHNFHPIEFGPNFSLPFTRGSTAAHMQTFLYIAVAFGLLHVTISFFIGIIFAKKGGHSKHMIGNLGMFMLLFGVIILVVNMLALKIGILGTVAGVISGVGFVLAMVGGGAMGFVEIIEAIGHAASYARIMAVGLVGAFLANAANLLIFQIMKGPGGIVIGAIIHLINFAIIVFSPSIHSLRLTFLEFFGPFFTRGTVPYKPFAKAVVKS